MKTILLLISLASFSCFAAPFQMNLFATYFTSSKHYITNALETVKDKDLASTCSYLGANADGGKYGIGAAMNFVDDEGHLIPGLPPKIELNTLMILVGKVQELNLRAYNANAFCKINLGTTNSFDGPVEPENWDNLKTKLEKMLIILNDINEILEK